MMSIIEIRIKSPPSVSVHACVLLNSTSKDARTIEEKSLISMLLTPPTFFDNL